MLTGCENFRDVGGYPASGGRHVRLGAVFRSDHLAGLTDADVGYLRDHVKLGTIVDLRRHTGIDSGHERICRNGATRYLNISLNREETADDRWPSITRAGLGEVYVWMVEGATDAVRQCFEMLADAAAYPVLFHCMGGKDRTGIIVALLLNLLGVSDEDIVDDYALTEVTRHQQSPQALRAAFDFVASVGVSEEWLYARRESMLAFLHRMPERHGSLESFVLECGVTRDHLRAIRAHLLT